MSKVRVLIDAPKTLNLLLFLYGGDRKFWIVSESLTSKTQTCFFYKKGLNEIGSRNLLIPQEKEEKFKFNFFFLKKAFFSFFPQPANWQKYEFTASMRGPALYHFLHPYLKQYHSKLEHLYYDIDKA